MVREILYRLFSAGEGWRLAQVLIARGTPSRVMQAIAWLRRHYHQPLSIQALAQAAHMSPSVLHHRFKDITAMSPLQYQKQLRLQEARRLLLGGNLNAATVSQRVGYESPSQFSRECSRLFGAPPSRDLRAQRGRPLQMGRGDA